ncbi:hypothetical protein R4227_00775 [Gordonia amicalis]|uniref:Intersectin-EH binding protein Ibp1 n=1 Tax=Gordonia amicalis TaxID=89053 RepID=A0ABU4D8F2_9ACTN|nr:MULTISPECIES: hypothetical protein [Gordonia]MDV6306009.1 hypothetical protein [Gordonia amicalis]MDV7098704.1 hypothetical protein [Gordonia amicalis]UKO90643.1 hypothetical protein IHQ52_16610 [Gordonia amicalis]
MVRIIPAARVIAALMFATALAGAATATAQPCQIVLPDGQLAPCAPGVVSTAPSDPGANNVPAPEAAQFAHTPLEHGPDLPAPEEEEPADDGGEELPPEE